MLDDHNNWEPGWELVFESSSLGNIFNPERQKAITSERVLGLTRSRDSVFYSDQALANIIRRWNFEEMSWVARIMFKNGENIDIFPGYVSENIRELHSWPSTLLPSTAWELI